MFFVMFLPIENFKRSVIKSEWMPVTVSRDLPAVETITVNMYREADKKKKKDRNALVCEYKYKRQSVAYFDHTSRSRWVRQA